MKEWERGGGQLIRQLDIVSYHAICNQCQWNIVDWLFLYIFIQSNKWVEKRFKLPPLSSSSPHSQCIVQLFTWARHIWRQSIRSKIKCTPSHHYHQHRRCRRRCHQNHHHPFNDAAAVEHRQHISSPCITEPPNTINECIWAMSLPLSMSHFFQAPTHYYYMLHALHHSTAQHCTESILHTCRIYTRLSLFILQHFDMICVSAPSHLHSNIRRWNSMCMCMFEHTITGNVDVPVAIDAIARTYSHRLGLLLGWRRYMHTCMYGCVCRRINSTLRRNSSHQDKDFHRCHLK